MKYRDTYKKVHKLDEAVMNWAIVTDHSIQKSGIYNAVVTIKDTDTLVGVIVYLYKLGYAMDNVSLYNMANVCSCNKTVFLINGHVSVGMICDSRFDGVESILTQQKEWVDKVAADDEFCSQKPFIDCGTDNVLFEIIAQCQHGDEKSIPYIMTYLTGTEELTFLPRYYDDLSEVTKNMFRPASIDYLKKHINDKDKNGISFRDRLE
jgi:hypothetical protein